MGFNVGNQRSVSPIYHCSACFLILQEPHQLSCGHRQCKTCIDEVEDESVICLECPKWPASQNEISKNDIFRDRGCENDMKNLSVICSVCEWDGVLKNYEEHQNQKHSNLICEHCKKQFSSTNVRDEHQEKHCISNRPVNITRYGSCLELSDINSSSHDNAALIQQSTALDMLNQDELETANIQHGSSSVVEIPRRETITTLMPPPANANNNILVQLLLERMATLTASLDNILENRQQLHQDTNQSINELMALLQNLIVARTSYEEQNSLINAIQINRIILQQEIATIRHTVDEAQRACDDGTLIWKITNVHEKMMDAQYERQTSIYSPPFFSSSTGYKMRARLYLYGDGNARRTHMSLFFVLMRGPNDAILKFPFNYKVTFCLYDQTSQSRHIIDSFRPDTKSNSFQRPRSEMNIASGIPKFCPLSEIQQEDNRYVRDDTMFIKVMVDFTNMPRRLTSNEMSPNPGLTMSTRRNTIEQASDSPMSPPTVTILPEHTDTQTIASPDANNGIESDDSTDDNDN